MDDGAALRDSDWVVGVELDGEARAYPLKILFGRGDWEAVSDTLAGHPLLVTYCPLCESAVVHTRIVGGEVLDLFNSGAIWHADLVLYDAQTGSQWSQVTGEAFDGPRHGERLVVLNGQTVRWGTWKATHPDTDAMAVPHDADGRALCSCDRDFSFRETQLVLGVVLDDQALAFPFPVLNRELVAHADLAGTPLVAARAGDGIQVFHAAGRTFEHDGEATLTTTGGGARYDALTGRALDGGPDLVPVAGMVSLANRWATFYPDSVFYQGEGLGERRDDDGPEETALPGAALPAAVVLGLLAAGLARRND
ncbi:MAG: DUF3179 domain-containing (seleno)protein [Thermoplasmatota archaeon]